MQVPVDLTGTAVYVGPVYIKNLLLASALFLGFGV